MAARSRAESIRRSILREWRGGDDPPDLDARVHRCEDFLTAVLKAAGANEGVGEERLREIWRDIAGDFVARHANPDSLRDGCLSLKVLQPAMRMHLEQMKAPLLAKLQDALGRDVVRRVRFVLG